MMKLIARLITQHNQLRGMLSRGYLCRHKIETREYHKKHVCYRIYYGHLKIIQHRVYLTVQ